MNRLCETLFQQIHQGKRIFFRHQRRRAAANVFIKIFIIQLSGGFLRDRTVFLRNKRNIFTGIFPVARGKPEIGHDPRQFRRIEAAQMTPVPRKLSSSCGTCVRYESETPKLEVLDRDTEAVYEDRAGEYTEVYRAET